MKALALEFQDMMAGAVSSCEIVALGGAVLGLVVTVALLLNAWQYRGSGQPPAAHTDCELSIVEGIAGLVIGGLAGSVAGAVLLGGGCFASWTFLIGCTAFLMFIVGPCIGAAGHALWVLAHDRTAWLALVAGVVAPAAIVAWQARHKLRAAWTACGLGFK